MDSLLKKQLPPKEKRMRAMYLLPEVIKAIEGKDAAFIVRAVNCHKVYEKALLRIQKALRQESGPEARSTVEMCEVIQAVVTEAITKAESNKVTK